MSYRDFEYITTLGNGSYSSVEKVRRKQDGQYYAMKKVAFGKLTDREKLNALNEIRFIASIDCPYIISYKEAFFESSTLCIIMEYADGGDLLSKIEEHKKKCIHFKEAEIWSTFIQITSALKALHDLSIVHRDIKCANIFMSNNNTVKLGDFNVSKIAKREMLCTQTGTPCYASPEVWKGKPYNCKSDIWSLGVVIYEMCSLKPPFIGSSMNSLYNKVMCGIYPSIPFQYSKEISNVIRMCLQTNPDLRPTCQQLLIMEKHRCNDFLKVSDTVNNAKLLSTIQFDNNYFILQSNLPKPSYQKGSQVRKAFGSILNMYSKCNNYFVPSPPLTERNVPNKPTQVHGFIRKVKKIDANVLNEIYSAPNSNRHNDDVHKFPSKPQNGRYVSNPRSHKYLKIQSEAHTKLSISIADNERIKEKENKNIIDWHIMQARKYLKCTQLNVSARNAQDSHKSFSKMEKC